MFEKLIQEMALLKEIDAICLGGSRATGKHDKDSDYDVYVYLNEDLKEEKRKSILDKYCSYMEYSNSFWELEDDGVLNNGIEIEFIYRSKNFLENILRNLAKGNVGHGFTTCFLDNLLDSQILVDKTGYIQNLKNKYKDLLNKDLAKKIVDNNFPLIYDSFPALFKQVKKAALRNDFHSVNHRVAAYFDHYYDILFAINLEPHPGEKRLYEYAKELKLLPKGYSTDIKELFNTIHSDNLSMIKKLEEISINLRNLLVDEGYINQ